jgi:hypothetical protein
MMNADDLEHYVAATGIVLGVIGAAWKWFFAEWLRVSREVPSLQCGEVRIVKHPAADGRAATLLEYNWKNTGSYPLYGDCEKLAVYVAPASKLAGLDSISSYDIAKAAAVTILPCRESSALIFDPGTNFQIQAIAMLDPAETYFVAHFVPLDLERHHIRRVRSRAKAFKPTDTYLIDRIDIIGPGTTQTPAAGAKAD